MGISRSNSAVEETTGRLATVLVVDDEHDILESVRDLLAVEMKHVRVHTATSGQAALDILKREGADLLITDYRMPGMSGIELLDALRRDGHDVPAILMTAFPDPTLAQKAKQEHGVRHFVPKPFELSQFLALVRAELG
jgi:CheY-like chemotaxis protein